MGSFKMRKKLLKSPFFFQLYIQSLDQGKTLNSHIEGDTHYRKSPLREVTKYLSLKYRSMMS